jgi:hypothetical protein
MHTTMTIRSSIYSLLMPARPVGDSPTIRVGIELDEASGKNDGTARGERYFRCEANKGIFVVPEKVVFAE